MLLNFHVAWKFLFMWSLWKLLVCLYLLGVFASLTRRRALCGTHWIYVLSEWIFPTAAEMRIFGWFWSLEQHNLFKHFIILKLGTHRLCFIILCIILINVSIVFPFLQLQLQYSSLYTFAHLKCNKIKMLSIFLLAV